MRPTPRLIMTLAVALAALLCVLAATWAASAIEKRSAAAVRRALVDAGQVWADVETDGLQVILVGEAPTEAARFRAMSVAGEVVDGTRVIDGMDVAEETGMKAPDFSVEILRNADGISLIGLVPETTDRAAIVESLSDLAQGGQVTDLLGTADQAAPDGWKPALDFALTALRSLPRSKISVSDGQVAITAISDSATEKARLEYELTRKASGGLRLTLDISAPRPVITPFTLRFLVDGEGARFDACSADTEKARDAIVAAAVAAGAEEPVSCTIGLGVPSPAWADAAVMVIRAVKDLGGGSVTVSDADIALISAETTDQATFDRVVGELESNLPDVFSLKASRAERADSPNGENAPAEFTASLAADGNVQLRGRITDTRLRDAVVSFARARFGKDSVYPAMRVDSGLPEGWPVRVLASIEALGELDSGSVLVRADRVRIEGVSGSKDTRDTVARILSAKLGEGSTFDISIRYDETLDPLASLPTPEECVSDLNAILARQKITFGPGSATITPEARGTLDQLATRMKDCAEVPMEVGGHTDAQGREEMNLQLSQDRAQAVITALIDRRILTGNLTARGYGESVPMADNSTEAGREANRRIEFRLLAPQAAPAGTGEEGAAAGQAAPEATVVKAPDDKTLRPKKRPEGQN